MHLLNSKNVFLLFLVQFIEVDIDLITFLVLRLQILQKFIKMK